MGYGAATFGIWGWFEVEFVEGFASNLAGNIHCSMGFQMKKERNGPKL